LAFRSIRDSKEVTDFYKAAMNAAISEDTKMQEAPKDDNAL